jgi:two-component system, NarL family, response regulator NreC
VVEEAASIAEGIRRFEQLSARSGVDVVVTDLDLSDGSGLELARRVKASGSGTRVLFLTMYQDAEHILGLLESSADGYLLKQAAVPELREAILAVARGEQYLSPAVARGLLVYLQHNPERERQRGRLSAREQQVLALMAEGETSKEIARHLGLSTKTVENYRSHIIDKLGVSNTAAAVSLAYREGLMADGL